jgi:hypothetical protein
VEDRERGAVVTVDYVVLRVPQSTLDVSLAKRGTVARREDKVMRLHVSGRELVPDKDHRKFSRDRHGTR